MHTTIPAPGPAVSVLAASPAPTPWYRRRAALVCTAAALAAGMVAAVGLPLAAAGSVASASTTVVAAAPWTPGASGGASSGSRWPGYSGGSSTGSTATTGGVAAATEASDDESTGVVIIDTELGYSDAAAAGTGMVLSSDGLVLTNNHVIEDSTAITITLPGTGATYSATVVGTDAENDVALLQLEGASGLETVTLDDDAESVGDAVTAVGNADGGGVLLAADGEITALESTLTTTATSGSASETLDGMIEIVADVVSGDSGGALLDAEGEVIGMTTAASVGSATTVAYAVPIDDALAIVEQILDGDESGTVAIGYPTFLGISIASSSAAGATRGGAAAASTVSGALVAGVYDGTPAAEIGLAAGDTITSIDGATVADAASLADILAGYEPGDGVSIAWTDAAGTTHSATATLIAGPAS